MCNMYMSYAKRQLEPSIIALETRDDTLVQRKCLLAFFYNQPQAHLGKVPRGEHR